MSDDFTANLALPYLLAGQAQKHVTVNESLSLFDSLIMASIVAADEQIPPDTPEAGQAWLIGPQPEGEWGEHAGEIAIWRDGVWGFLLPNPGWRVWDQNAGRLLVFEGQSWRPLRGDMQNLEYFGLGAQADEATPFLASLNSALFTARPNDESGTGDVRLTLNKPEPQGVSALAFQTDYQGRAEFGLLGSEEVRLNLSADGQTWRSALIAVPELGNIGLGAYPDGDTQLSVQGRLRVKSEQASLTLHEAGRLELRQSEGARVEVQASSPGSPLHLGAVSSENEWMSGLLILDPDGPAVLSASHVCPQTALALDLGHVEAPWRDLYLSNEPIVATPDPKQMQVKDLGFSEALVQGLRPVCFRRPGEAVQHFGFIGSEVHTALSAAGYSDAALCVERPQTLGEPPKRDLRTAELVPILVGVCQSLLARVAHLEGVLENGVGK